jgi:hypothetical protein
MSSLKDSDKLCAKLSVKVPQPDSLVEVRVTPPDSNFEVKILPGEEVIELTIRPVGSLIEVRIGPAGMEPAEARKILEPVAADPDLDYAAEEVPAEEAKDSPVETAPAEAPDFDENLGEVSAVPDSDDHPSSGAAGPAVLAALARLSVAVGEDRAALDNVLEAQSQSPKPEPAQPDLEEEVSPLAVEPALAGSAEPEAMVAEESCLENSPLVSLLTEEEEAALASPLAEEEESAPAPPLAEEDDLEPAAEHQDEELAIGPIDVQDLAGVDLDQGRPDDGPVVKAKPLVKAAVPVA